jgi:hypothetical protein
MQVFSTFDQMENKNNHTVSNCCLASLISNCSLYYDEKKLHFDGMMIVSHLH